VRSSTLQTVRQQLKEAAKADDAPQFLKGVDWDTASLADARIEIEPSALRILTITHWLSRFWFLWGAIVFCVCLAGSCFWLRRSR
jgi:hypothetical protein